MSLSLVSSTVEILVICAGLSIILGAFGSTATVNIPGQSIALVGVAAVAVALFILLLNQMSDRYLHLRVSGDIKPEQVTSVDFSGDYQYAGGYQQSQRTWDFYIFGGEIRSPKLTLRIVLLDKDKRERPFACIDADILKPHLASGKTIQWSFNSKKNTITDVTTKKLVTDEVGECNSKLDNIEFADVKKTEWHLISLFDFFPSAYADEPSPSTAELIGQLDSDGDQLRRNARDQLARRGEEIVKPLMVSLATPDATYRTQLGALVALARMSRNRNIDLDQVRKSLTPDDINRLLDTTTDEDKTIRVYGSEFLYRLADPRTIQPAFEKIPDASADGKYNLLVVVKGSIASANEDQKKLASEAAENLRVNDAPKTNKIIDELRKAD